MSRRLPPFRRGCWPMVAAGLAVRQSYQPNKGGESDPLEDRTDPLITRARIALMSGLAVGLLVLGPAADAQTTSSATKSATASKNAKAKDAKAKVKAGKKADSKSAKT